MRAPDMPMGWPRASAPPLTLTLSSEMPSCAGGDDADRGERLVHLDEVEVGRLDALAGVALSEYLPASYRSPSEEEYIAFLWDAFETNYGHGKYQFAFLAYHLLTMCAIYFHVWKIKSLKSVSSTCPYLFTVETWKKLA